MNVLYTEKTDDIMKFIHPESLNLYHAPSNNSIQAADCIECGQCELICPQHILVMEEMKKISAVFD